MKIKDETIIGLLIITWTFMVVIVLGADTKYDKLTEQLQHLGEQHQELEQEVMAELAEHEDRIELMEHNYEVIHIRVNSHWQKLLEVQGQLNNHVAVIAKSATPTPKSSNKSKRINVKVSEKDIRNIAALVYLEAGSCSYKCQKAIASVVFNRMVRYKKTATQAIYESGVFTVSGRVARTTPSSESLRAVRDVLNNGSIFPTRVTAFRNNRYHSFGKKYCCIDGVYFTYV